MLKCCLCTVRVSQQAKYDKLNKKEQEGQVCKNSGGVAELDKKPSFEFMLGVGGKIVDDSLKIVTAPFIISYVYVYTGKW